MRGIQEFRIKRSFRDFSLVCGHFWIPWIPWISGTSMTARPSGDELSLRPLWYPWYPIGSATGQLLPRPEVDDEGDAEAEDDTEAAELPN